MADSLSQLNEQMEQCLEDIKRKELEIAETVNKIKETEQELKKPKLSKEDKAFYMKKEEDLRAKEKDLRDEKKDLRDKEKDLREEKKNLSNRMAAALTGYQSRNASHDDTEDLSTYPHLPDSHQFSILVRTLENSELVNNGRFIKFQSPVQLDEFHLPSHGIMIRECYPRLKNLMLTTKSQNIHLGGTPGIGKSAFMCYLLYCVINAREEDSPERDYDSILFDTGKRWADVFLWRRGQPTLRIKGTIPLVPLRRPGVLQLVELESGESPCVISYTTSVIAASPWEYDQANVHKISELKSFIMPLWSLQELTECLQVVYNETSQEKLVMLEKLYQVYGGIPRSVIDNGVRAIENDSDLEKYINHLKQTARIENMDQIIQKMNIMMNYGKAHQYHSLVHYAVDDYTFKSTKLVFASRDIADIIVEACFTLSPFGMLEFLNGYLSIDYMRYGLTEQFFENGAIKIIAEGGEFDSAHAFYTSSNKTKQARPAAVTTIPKYTKIIRYKSLQNVQEMLNAGPVRPSSIQQTLFVPQSTMNPTFDAFSFPNNVFKFTIREKHDCKPSTSFQQLMNLMHSYIRVKARETRQIQTDQNEKLNFYWILPEQVFDSFAIKPQPIDLNKEERETQDQMDQQLEHIKVKIQLSKSTASQSEREK